VLKEECKEDQNMVQKDLRNSLKIK
jgi:hypothetical protein